MIRCLICGKYYDRLYTHLIQAHEISTQEYRRIYGKAVPIVSKKVRESCKKGFFAALSKLSERGSLYFGYRIFGSFLDLRILEKCRRKAQALYKQLAKQTTSCLSSRTYPRLLPDGGISDKTKQARQHMRTYPCMAPREDEIRYDLKKLKVEIVDGPTNPYKAIFTLVTSTWGSRKKWWTRWEDATPVGRLTVVKAALAGQTLPTALECPSFTFKIQGMTRASYDQLARERYSGIGSMGSRDDAHLDAALILPPRLKRYSNDIRSWWKATKDLYEKIVISGKESWQTARFILPSGMEWRFTWTMNYRAFQQMVAKRMCFAEQHDTVAVAWLMWNKMWEKWPLLAAYARPACDRAGRCLYSQRYTLAEMFGNLFLPCGRHPVKHLPEAIFNEVSCTREELLKIMPKGTIIPKPDDWATIEKEAVRRDMKWFLK